MRARSGCADCALVTRAVYDAHPPDPARARGDVPRHGLSLLASSQKKLGLADRGRARSAARKTNQAHCPRTGRAIRHERRAADAPCGRLVFSKRPQRKTGARLSGRTLRPNDDAVPPMEDIEDDRSGVLAAAGGSQPGLHGFKLGAHGRRARLSDIPQVRALLMLDYLSHSISQSESACQDARSNISRAFSVKYCTHMQDRVRVINYQPSPMYPKVGSSKQ